MQPTDAVSGGLWRATAGISAVTAVARVLGFARWVVFGLTVGATYLGNTYQTANWVPNILFDLVAGGVLSAVFVPTFVAELEAGRERAEHVASGLLNVFLVASVPVVLIGIAAGAPIMRAFTAGVDDPVVRAREVVVGAFFLRYFLPQVPLYLIGMVMRGLLHAHDRFALSAAAPAFASVITIGAYVAFRAMGPGADLDTVSTAQLHVLGAGTTIGVAAWALCQVPPVLRLGFRWRPVLAVRDPAVRRAVRAGTYGLAFFFVTQLGFVATLVLANRVPGGVVAFQIAFAFYELPNALLAFPVATAVFPALARRAAEGQVEAFGRLLSRGMRSQGVLIVPAAVGVFVVARPLIEAVFARGATSEAGAGLVAVTLAGMALGLPAYALTQTLVRAFYARHETRPPVVVNAAAVGTYVVAAVTATVVALPAGEEAMGVIGVTHAAGQWVGLGVGAWILARRVPQWPVLGDARSLGASVARSALMGVAVWAVLGRLGGTPTSLRAGAGIAAGAVAYGLLSFRVPEVGETIRLVRRRGSADGS